MKIDRTALKSIFLTGLVVGLGLALITTAPVSAAGTPCGKGDQAYTPAIDLGCKGEIDNPIMDMLFGILRFLSNGVGLVIVISLVWAGIQYSMARGIPQEAEKAQKRILSTVGALLLFIFAYAIINYLVPGFIK
jgi:hypothetical protein